MNVIVVSYYTIQSLNKTVVKVSASQVTMVLYCVIHRTLKQFFLFMEAKSQLL